MKQGVKQVAMIICLAGLTAFGCAKQELVKDAPLVNAQTQQDEAARKAREAKAAQDVAVQQDSIKTVEQLPQANQKVIAEFKLDTVYFDFDKSDLRQDTRDILSKNAAALLKKYADTSIRVEGHCDERGSDEYNLALGERRAKSVAAYLVTLGIKSDRISTISYGKEKPVVTGSDEASYSKNRRAEFVIAK
jgi:peptidoglycan-associated lipoprotein